MVDKLEKEIKVTTAFRSLMVQHLRQSYKKNYNIGLDVISGQTIQKTRDPRQRDLISDWKTGEALWEQVTPKLGLRRLFNYNMNNGVKNTVEIGTVHKNP